MIKLIYPNKDTTIFSSSDSKPLTLPGGGFSGSTYANAGASQILSLKKYINTQISGATSGRIAGGYPIDINRILMSFDLTNLSASIRDGVISDSGKTLQVNLKMYNATDPEQSAKSFDVFVHPVLSKSWDEGNGLDVDTYKDIGYANWVSNNSTSSWYTGGLGTGSVAGLGLDQDYTSVTYTINTFNAHASKHFDTGIEDLNVDVTNLIGFWLSGTLTNRGFLVKYSDTNETNSVDYVVKNFFSKNSHTNRKPRLEVKYVDFFADDRGHFYSNATNSLYLYHVHRGNLADIQYVTDGINNKMNFLSCSIFSGSISGSFPTHSALSTSQGYNIPCKRNTNGIYVTDEFSLPRRFLSGSSSGIFYDIWHNSTVDFITTRSFEFYNSMTDDNTDYVGSNRLLTSITNIKQSYDRDKDTNVRFDVNVKRKGTSLDDSRRTKTFIIHTGSYEIREKTTQEVMIPFDDSFTKLSYNEFGNYFDVDMTSFDRGRYYNIILKYKMNNQIVIDPNIFEFKVV